MSNKLIQPHGGKLLNLYCNSKDVENFKNEAINFQSHTLTDRQLCDLELILNGAFSPLDGFMDQESNNSVLDSNRLKDGTIWPMPILLDISLELSEGLEINDNLESNPELINEDPYQNGWILKIKIKNINELDGLLSNSDYEKLIK